MKGGRFDNGPRVGAFSRDARNVLPIKGGKGGTPASEIEKLRRGDWISYGGEPMQIQTIKAQTRTSPVFDDLDPTSLKQGERKTRVVTVKAMGGSGISKFTFYGDIN